MKPKYKYIGIGTQHIDSKDMVDEAIKNIRSILDDMKEQMQFTSYQQLFYYSDKPGQVWYRAQNTAFISFSKVLNRIAKEKAKRLKIAISKTSEFAMMNKEQVKNLQLAIGQGMVAIQSNVLQQHKNTISNIGNRVLKHEQLELHKEISNMILNNAVGNYGTVRYEREVPMVDPITGQEVRNERGVLQYTKQEINMTWEAYIERKVRTEIQHEVASNMVAYGHQNGMVFMISSFYGDCAKDHADYQGRIYYDEDWEDNIEDEELKQQIQEYIDSKHLMSVQNVMNEEPWLTTRPNCRHFFQFIGIDEVLSIKTKDDLNQYREENMLNYNGSYKAEKYKALQDQRHNERKIREFKEKEMKMEMIYNSLPKDTPAIERMKHKAEIEFYNDKVKEYQTKQRKLVKENDNLVRDYNREAPGDIYDMGVK